MLLSKKSFIAYTLFLATSCYAAQEALEPQTFGQAHPHFFSNREEPVWTPRVNANGILNRFITLTITAETDFADIQRQIQEWTELAPENQLLYWQKINRTSTQLKEVSCLKDMAHPDFNQSIKLEDECSSETSEKLFLAKKKKNQTFEDFLKPEKREMKLSFDSSDDEGKEEEIYV